jgi:hypothetical protein
MGAGTLVTVVTLLGSLNALAADDRWIEVKSPHFTVVSNASDKTARNVAWQFEQIRAAIQAGWPWARVQLDRPVTVVAAKDEASMKLLLPQYWEKGDRDSRPISVFSTAPDAYYITMRSDVQADDTQGINPYYASYWAYSTIALDAAFETQLPLWFRSGLAEVLSNSIVRENEIQFGRAIPWHLTALRGGRVRLSELMTMTSQSPYYNDSATRAQFDAQCWGVMHYLLFGRSEDRADRVNQIAKLLLDGKSSADAVQEALGSVDALETAYLQYQQKPITQFARLKVTISASAKDFASHALSASDSVVTRAALHGAMNRAVDARALIAESRKSAPTGSRGYEVEAMLLDREGKRDEARAAFAKAAELNSESFYAHYRLALLMWRSDLDEATRGRIEALAKRSVALNESYANAYALLADAIARGPQAADGVAPALKALALEPANSSHRLSLARVYWAMGRRDSAKATALAGRALSRSDAERREAEDLLAFFNRAETKSSRNDP